MDEMTLLAEDLVEHLILRTDEGTIPWQAMTREENGHVIITYIARIGNLGIQMIAYPVRPRFRVDNGVTFLVDATNADLTGVNDLFEKIEDMVKNQHMDILQELIKVLSHDFSMEHPAPECVSVPASNTL